MFFIPGWAIGILTFPGVILHEIAHRLFCDLAGVPVYDVRYFKPGARPAGYVVHGPVKHLGAAFLISFGPLLINTLLCSLITFTAIMPLFFLNLEDVAPLYLVLFWVGLSIGMHAFPGNEDAENFQNHVDEADGNILLKAVAWILAMLLRVVNALRFFWIDAIYAVAVSLFLPWVTGLL